MRTTRNTETNRPSDALVWHQMSAESAAQRLNSDLERIRAAGAKLFLLPKYNPDLNPIEQVFAKLKTLLRRAARRTTDAIWRQFGKAAQRVLATRMRQLLPQRRIRFKIDGSHSSFRCSMRVPLGRPAEPQKEIGGQEKDYSQNDQGDREIGGSQGFAKPRSDAWREIDGPKPIGSRLIGR